MKIFVLKSKIHQARVTSKNINYTGSITIDTELIEKVNLFPYEKVDIYDIDNGERFTTYVLEGKRGSKDIILNGAAARKVEIGDRIIIAAYTMIDTEEQFSPQVIILDKNNNITSG
jgi:aspartate 1-decarboxylase